MSHKLPRPKLVPLFISMGRRHAAYRPVLHPETQRIVEEMRAAIAARVWKERPWRIANQRQRLYACHWAGWKPAWLRPPRISTMLRATPFERWGACGRKWLLSHTAPIRHTPMCDFKRRWWIRAPDITA